MQWEGGRTLESSMVGWRAGLGLGQTGRATLRDPLLSACSLLERAGPSEPKICP